MKTLKVVALFLIMSAVASGVVITPECHPDGPWYTCVYSGK